MLPVPLLTHYSHWSIPLNSQLRIRITVVRIRTRLLISMRTGTGIQILNRSCLSDCKVKFLLFWKTSFYSPTVHSGSCDGMFPYPKFLKLFLIKYKNYLRQTSDPDPCALSADLSIQSLLCNVSHDSSNKFFKVDSYGTVTFRKSG